MGANHHSSFTFGMRIEKKGKMESRNWRCFHLFVWFCCQMDGRQSSEGSEKYVCETKQRAERERELVHWQFSYPYKSRPFNLMP